MFQLIVYVTACLTFVNTISAQTTESTVGCNSTCLEYYRPVCGSDGITYDNECFFEYGRCKGAESGKFIEIVSYGVCQPEGRPTQPSIGMTTEQDNNATLGMGGNYTEAEPIGRPTIGQAAAVTGRPDETSTFNPCVMYCKPEYKPVCGSDNITYSNACELRRAVCYEADLTMQYRGACGSPEPDCERNCSSQYRPVCASNGRTYSNRCFFDSEECKAKASGRRLTIKYYGSCVPTTTPWWYTTRRPTYPTTRRPSTSSCSNTLATCRRTSTRKYSWCLTYKYNSRTYKVNIDGPCTSNYYRCIGRQVTALSTRPCSSSSSITTRRPPQTTRYPPSGGSNSSCPSYCSSVYKPVCGSDSITYTSFCHLQQVACRYSTPVYVKYNGACRPSIRTTPSPSCNFTCPSLYDPVCGSNRKTYQNICSLTVASCKSTSTITMLSTGRCPSGFGPGPGFPNSVQKRAAEDDKCNFACFALYDPVCGSDGKTYSNGCEMSRGACQQGMKLTAVSNGRCEDVSKTTTVAPPQSTTAQAEAPVCSMICPFIYSPVCGSNGKTYSNKCELDVDACVTRSKISIAQYSACVENKVTDSPCPQFCTLQYDPVCGSDGRTYSNTCALNVRACVSKTNIQIASRGQC